jgi:hypothetical protein
MANHTFSNTRIGIMLKEARESGDERLETRALYIWGCRQYRKMLRAGPYQHWDKTAERDYLHAANNFDNLPHRIRAAVLKSYPA